MERQHQGHRPLPRWQLLDFDELVFVMPCVSALTPRAMGWIVSLVLFLVAVPAGASYDKHSLDVEGVEREYYVWVPPHLVGKTELPVVIAFHGFMSDAGGLRWLTKMDSWIGQSKFAVVLPNAIDKSWNAGKGSGSRNTKTDDLAFLRELLQVLPVKHGFDASRLFAMGFSNGAQMVALGACRLADKLAGGAMVAHTLNIRDCEPSEGLPMMIIHGAKDTMAPFQGGGPHSLASHQETVDFFRQLNQANDEQEPWLERESVQCRRFSGGAAKLPVVACVCKDAGHTWPGGVEFKPEVFGAVNTELAGGPEVLRFFSALEVADAPKAPPLHPSMGRRQNRYGGDPNAPPR